jgi:hypothetical protein
VKKTSVKERRAHERHATRLDVQGTPDAGGTVARMVARNLSVGGLYCTSPTDFPEMTRLAVRLMLPQNGAQANAALEPVDVEAIVVRRSKTNGSSGSPRYDLALYFPNLDHGTRVKIESYLERQQA